MKLRPMIVAAFVCCMGALGIVAQNEGLHGVVLDRETGQPVAASKVSVVHVLDPTGSEKQSGVNSITVMTEDHGSYHIPKEKVDLIWSSKLILFGTAREYGFEAKRIDRSQLGRHDFLLPRPVKVAGRVVSPLGFPVANAVVGTVYIDATLENGASHFPWQYEGVYTGEDGRFSTIASPNLQFVVEADHPDFVPAYTLPYEAANSLDHPDEFVIQLEEGCTVRGTVRDAAARTVAGVKVQLFSLNRRMPFPASRAFLHRLNREAISAADGGFVFRGVLPGEKKIVIEDLRGMAESSFTAQGESVQLELQLSKQNEGG